LGLIGRPQEALLWAKAKRQRQMFYLCESEATATNVFCSESKATATKRSVGTEINLSFCGRAIFYFLTQELFICTKNEME